ncbi:MAG: alpha/beta hydrolase [Deltaproteobacteria bacterium]|nr:alpha/beta hydrolase [Deltaproteobacteria bacterium]
MARDADVIGPSSSFYVSQRLRMHYVDWGNESAPPLLLIHGGKDHARNWDWVARELRSEFHVIAPDLRGHGDSAWAIGGSYAISEFVFDIIQLVDALHLAPLTIIGHSLGGAISLHYTGLYPQNVKKLVAIEGLGPSPELEEKLEAPPASARYREWIKSQKEIARRQPRRYASIDDAAKRMQDENEFLSPEQARHLTVHGVARNEDGTFSWKFDPYVRSFAPVRFRGADVRSLWERVTCPTLLVRGEDSWASDPMKDGRIASFKNARLANVPKAGHWVHHDQLDVFLREVRKFLAE